MAQEASWVDAMPAIYDRCLGPALFAPCARHLAQVVADMTPRSVLEIAAGTGILTAELVRLLPGVGITATDLNAAMVSWAAAHVSGPTWLPADAMALPFPAGSFDLIACQFGVMFFPDKAQAFAQFASALQPGGHVVFSVWDAVGTSPFPAAVSAAVAELFPDDPPDFVTRIPHGYHAHDRIRSDVAAGGLEVRNVERFVLRGSAPSALVLAEGFCLGTPLRFALAERGDLAQLTDAVADAMTARLGPGRVAGDLAGFVVTARRL